MRSLLINDSMNAGHGYAVAIESVREKKELFAAAHTHRGQCDRRINGDIVSDTC